MLLHLFSNLKSLKIEIFISFDKKSIFRFHHLKRLDIFKNSIGGDDLEISFRTLLLFIEVLIKLFLIFVQ